MNEMSVSRKAVTRIAVLLLTLGGCAGLLTSCATTQESAPADPVFKFSVMQYKEPVPVKSWVIDPAQSANPEGAALNIITAMQQGNLDFWLASWDNTERPVLAPPDREALLEKWRPLKDGQVSVLGRVVAGADLVINFTVLAPQQKQAEINLPLKRAAGQWWLTAMDPSSEFLNWQNSTNKILLQVETTNFVGYLRAVQAPH